MANDLQHAIKNLINKVQRLKEEGGLKGLCMLGETNLFFDSGMTVELIIMRKYVTNNMVSR
ncbi:MAG: hypothetical protein ACJ72V_05690 [Nitrososphaeraceae archaeon]